MNVTNNDGHFKESSMGSQLYHLLLALPIIAFLALLVLEALTNQLCCADDASFAIVSKNLAHGLGYAFSLNYQGSDYSTHLFDPALGTGPVSILSSALLIKVLGARPWVPGLSTALLCATYLYLIGSQLRLTLGHRTALISITSFTILVLTFSIMDFHYWSAQLGEGPAALAVILGYLYWTNAERHARYAFYAGILLCLSFLTKELSALYILALFGYVAITFLIGRITKGETQDSSDRIAFLLIGLLLPLIAFELYRLVALGSLHSYKLYWREHIAFIRSQGINGNGHDISVNVTTRILSLFSRYVPSFISLILAGIVIIWGFISTSGHPRRLATLVAVGIVLHMVYWIWFSIGWPRYAFTAVVLFAFLISLQAQVENARGWLTLGTCVLAFFLVCLPRAGYLRSSIAAGRPPPPAEIRDSQKLLEYMADHNIQRPIYTGWWADVANLEYLSKTPDVFSGYLLALQHKPKGPFPLVTNSRFPLSFPDFLGLLKHCRKTYSVGEYTLYTCELDSGEDSLP